MPYVRVLSPFQHNGEFFKAGEVVDFSSAHAAEYQLSGLVDDDRQEIASIVNRGNAPRIPRSAAIAPEAPDAPYRGRSEEEE